MTRGALTALLAEQVLGWRAVPNRFIKDGRSWIPRWRFNPMENLEDAFLLLDRTGGAYTLALDPEGGFTAEVRIGDRVGRAFGNPKARTITFAVAQALGIEVVS